MGKLLRSAWLWISGAILGALALARFLFVRTVRIEKEFASVLYDMVREEGRYFVLDEELSVSDRLPRVFTAYCAVRGLWMKFSVVERMLRAGWQGTDSIAEITIPRWHFKKLVKLMKTAGVGEKKDYITINIMGTWGSYRLGKRKIPETLPTPYTPLPVYDDLEREIVEMIDGKIEKTSALLYGPPGNGKTFLARYLALKYGVNVHILVLQPDITNQDLVKSFSHVKGPAMILIEDFDSYFNLRECALEESKFSLGAILNVLDGTYMTLEKVAVVMTANDLEKVDPALKTRPGRLRHTIEVPNPDASMRAKVLAGHPDQKRLVRELDGCNLDEVIAARDSEELADQAIRRLRAGEDIESSKPLFFVKKEKKEEEKAEIKSMES